MKALKIVLTIIGILVAAMLIVPLITPATAEVSAEIEIALKPSQVFPAVASFMNREAWDPWVANDSTTKVTIQSEPGYVGSTYTWEGDKLGAGKMEVISVVENEHIESFLWFGDVDSPSLVEWTFEPVDGGTRVVWSFAQETTYPIGRLGMIFGKVFLEQSFETGLASLKEFLEAMPQTVSSLGPITIETKQAIVAMVARGSGTMETIGEDLGRLYGMIMMEVEMQQLQMAGAPFINYLDYDESTGHSNYMAGIPVAKAGVKSGEVVPIVYNEMKVLQAMHTGPYEEFTISYDKFGEYISSNGLEVTGEAFEFYLTDPTSEPDASKLQTLIAFPLK
ncbi:MAG: SRPBCC family protein [Bacteroidales bacterium]|nr:SRPBCC family protein [Bacteroidales bacterium]